MQNQERESKWGEGSGTPMEHCANPNNPSYDPATGKATFIMDWLARYHWEEMTEWEKKFVLGCYSRPTHLTKKQHVFLRKIGQKFAQEKAKT